jgi:hypothetical protein
VGARCRDCARIKKIPTFRVSGQYYLKAVGVGLGLGIALGVALGFILSYLSFYFFSLIIAFGVGWVVGELVSRAANRKRSVWLAVIGGSSVALCYIVIYLVDFYRYGYFDFDITRTVFNLLAIGVAIYYAVSRLR